jgi:hypothetical protein
MALGARMSRPGRAIDPTIGIHSPPNASLQPLSDSEMLLDLPF